jgi:hypothetical protein
VKTGKHLKKSSAFVFDRLAHSAVQTIYGLPRGQPSPDGSLVGDNH